MAKTIMVVDDKSSVRRLLEEYLVEQGFHVVTADNGQNALYTARHVKPDLILLDIMMPQMDGYEFIRRYRKERNIPIILLTARLDETDKVLGLELGADDYITKPFGMRELLARIRAVLRRVDQKIEKPDIIRIDQIILDLSSHLVRISDEVVELTPSEFKILEILMTSPGRVYSRLQLMEMLQGPALDGVLRTIDVHVRNLRSKIEPDASKPTYIETVFGVGYRFKAEPS